MLNRRRFLQQAALVTGAAAIPVLPRTVSSNPVDVEPFGDATVISGNPRERGRQYGRRFADEITSFLDREIVSAFADSPSTKEDLLRYAGACWKVIQAECPVIADEMEGMAEGSGLRIEEHVLITLHEELYHRGVLPPVPHCTAVAVGPPETKGGTTYVGQTWDWMPSVAGRSTMLKWQRDEGPSLLAYAFPGLWVGAGLNASGVSLCWTSADLGKPDQSPRIGLPSYVLLAHLLYQQDLDAVQDTARRNRHAGWFTFVLGDGTGRLLNVEGSPEGVTIEQTTGRLIRIGFGTRAMSKTPADETVAVHPRCRTMEALLDQAAGNVDLATMQRSFGEPSCGVCVPNTIDMMVFDNTLRTAHLSRGSEFGVAWKSYRFS